MVVRLLLIVLMVALLGISAAFAQLGRFKVGDRVVVVTTRQTGTVEGVSADGKQLQIRFDLHPQTLMTYYAGTPDLQPSTTAPQAPGNTAPATNPAVSGTAPTLPSTATRPTTRPATPDAPDAPPYPGPQNMSAVPNSAPPTAATFQQLIRLRYCLPKDGDADKSVTFQSFQVSGPTSYEAVYARGGEHGHVYQAWRVHTRYTFLKHYFSKTVWDEYRKMEGTYMCYRTQSGEWVAEQGQMVPGSEHTMYIKNK